ncbi:hypothetical protein NBE99_03170 [Thermosynechococcus sp. HN-54]|uniref:hypothetical protein n=1 Tax=Thermosynechococcus sp. HN-54 TaxID=2933959 RepID=UPI00202CC3D1|nr:hypothetical protein [Thermosynechococcus sp. HN-54]URR36147.1 hypothetical protein NBE99_03170 [Thermosynechococcus sp. HN-54]
MYYERKLFALLHDPYLKALYTNKALKGAWQQVSCLNQHAQDLQNWWNHHSGVTADHIASASDRLSFQRGMSTPPQPLSTRPKWKFATRLLVPKVISILSLPAVSVTRI